VSHSSVLLSAVLVPARRGQRLVVAFGDSITDGDGSTVEADRTWPSALARRLNQRESDGQTAVVNAGIAGNRLLADGFGIKSLGISALARFDRDVLSLPGVTHVVLLEGLNDLAFPGATLGGQALADAGETRTVADVIDAYRQLIARAHARGVKVIGATLTPFEGTDVPGYYSDAKEAARQAVNTWIRQSGAFDGVIDFDARLRDERHPARMQARYASDDHLHPNDGGYQAMADGIDLLLFE
jgi:lysophospholipase L1-like esterase